MPAKDRPFTKFAAEVCGFADNLNAGKCPTCGCADPDKTINSELSAKEFTITGMCQACQDKIFGAGEEEDEL